MATEQIVIIIIALGLAFFGGLMADLFFNISSKGKE
jgi:hypothetical protein